MSQEYTEVSETSDVPKNTGVRGFLHAIELILKLPRVQHIEVDSRGRVSYTYFIRKGEERAPLKTDFETLKPYMAIRNCESIDELAMPNLNAAISLGQLFDMCAVDHLFPVAFVAGAQSKFWDWAASSGLRLSSRDELFGLPFLTDRFVPDESLVLGAAFAKDSALIDIRKGYKLSIAPTVKAITA